MSPTQRTLRALRARGLPAAVVEHWNPHARVRQDLFGIIDILALDPARGVVGIQCTGPNLASRVTKLSGQGASATRAWLSTPGTRLEVWAWRRIKVRRGLRRMKWEPRIYELTLAGEKIVARVSENANVST